LIRVLITGIWAAVLISGAEPPAKLRIRIFNLAAVPASEVSGAQNHAQQILASAGILVDWEEGDPDADEARELDMSAPLEMGNTTDVRRTGVISARILPRVPKSLSPGTLGMALPFASRGIHVTLFADRIGEVARTMRLSRGQVLGTALAHEVGHMLLGSSKHASTGIMRERWNYNEYVLIAMGRLEFIASEAQRMRSRLLRKWD
jgi:hypothetical protein